VSIISSTGDFKASWIKTTYPTYRDICDNASNSCCKKFSYLANNEFHGEVNVLLDLIDVCETIEKRLVLVPRQLEAPTPTLAGLPTDKARQY
jgi:hypothetical protein